MGILSLNSQTLLGKSTKRDPNMNQPKTQYLKDYQPCDFAIECLHLTFNLFEEHTWVTAKMRVIKNKASVTSLRLVGEDLVLKQVCLNNNKLSDDQYQLNENSLELFNVPSEFDLEIHTEIYPHKNTVLMGLYQSSHYYVTQCEPEGFRRITYFLDRPDVLTTYKTTIEADKQAYPVLLSNGNCIAQGDKDAGRHWVTWEDPFKKPSYLFALVAGNLACLEEEFITRSNKKVKLQVYAEQKDIEQCHYALTCLQQAMQWDEETYGREYDLDCYMIVAVSDFNMGAMENKGLNVFNTKYVLVDPNTATDQDFQAVQSVISHEYFHNWSGNRVTCRDWFQLSLKEGLTIFRDQSFSADLNSAAVKRIQDVRVLQTVQFAEDRGPMAHPVQPDHFIEINNFYTVTVYNKGAEVIRMMHTLIGPNTFRKAMDLYFERHDGSAVTIHEFVTAMEDASGYDLTQFRRWYHQAGTPNVRLSDNYDEKNQQYTLSIEQHPGEVDGREQQQAFHIPIKLSLLDTNGQAIQFSTSEPTVVQMDSSFLLELKSPKQTWTFAGLKQAPTPSLFHGFSAPVQWQYDYSDEQLGLLLRHDSDPFARWNAGQQLMMRSLIANVEAYQNKKDMQLSNELLAAVEHLLTNLNHDEALLAELLSLPSERYIAQCLAVVDPEAIHYAHQYVQQVLAVQLQALWQTVYQDRYEPNKAYEVNAQAVGRRRLKNVCLDYLNKTQQAAEIERCYQQYREATNMTDRMVAFDLLAHSETPLRTTVLDDFYQQWQQSPLVIDKWFAVQASSPLVDTAQQVQAMLEHKDFCATNPNRVRALLGVFTHNNLLHFHQANGNAYGWITDQIIKFDGLNPHTATSLASAFNQWRRFDKARQDLMRAQLQRIIQTPKISNDLYEIVSRALGL